jgi:hypothetical protein
LIWGLSNEQYKPYTAKLAEKFRAGGRMIKKRKWSKRSLNESDFERYLEMLHEEHVMCEWDEVKETIRWYYIVNEDWFIDYELTNKSVRKRLGLSISQWDRFMYYIASGGATLE